MVFHRFLTGFELVKGRVFKRRLNYGLFYPGKLRRMQFQVRLERF